MLDDVLSLVTAITTVILVFIALRGLSQWRSTIKGQAILDLATKMILQARLFELKYNSARDLNFILSMRIEETVDMPKSKNESRDQPPSPMERYARTKMHDHLCEVYQQLAESSILAEYLLSDKIPELIKPLETAIVQMAQALRAYYDDALKPLDALRSDDPNRLAWDQHRSHSSELVYGKAEDKYGQQVKKTVTDLIQFLKPYSDLLRSRKKWWPWSWINSQLSNRRLRNMRNPR